MQLDKLLGVKPSIFNISIHISLSAIEYPITYNYVDKEGSFWRVQCVTITRDIR